MSSGEDNYGADSRDGYDDGHNVDDQEDGAGDPGSNYENEADNENDDGKNRNLAIAIRSVNLKNGVIKRCTQGPL